MIDPEELGIRLGNLLMKLKKERDEAVAKLAEVTGSTPQKPNADAAAIVNALADVAEAMRAPKTLVMDSDDKPVGVRVGKQ